MSSVAIVTFSAGATDGRAATGKPHCSIPAAAFAVITTATNVDAIDFLESCAESLGMLGQLHCSFT